MIQRFLEACPSFEKNWEEHRAQNGTDILYYIVLGDFAHHLLELHQNNQTETFPAIARAIEDLLLEGDSFVKEAASIGLLEAIQNVWANNEVDPELFYSYLLPISAKWWQSVNDFWNGKIKSVGEGL